MSDIFSNSNSIFSPNYNFGANASMAGLNFPAQQPNAAFYGNLNNVKNQSQYVQDNLFASGGGFGNQSYGRVGGYPSFGGAAAPGTYSPGGGRSSFSGTPLGGGGGGGGYPGGTVTRGPDLPNLSPSMPAYPGVPYLGTGGGDPFGGGGFSNRGGSPFAGGSPSIPYLDSPAGRPFGSGGFNPGMPAAPNFGDTFSHYRGNQTPAQMQNQPAIDQVLQFNGRGTGVAPDQPFAMPPSEGAAGTFGSRFSGAPEGGAGSPGSFADRFAPSMSGKPGTPSQYTTEPYTRTDGRTFQPNIPSGYETPFSFDNPGGALPASRGSPFPVMGASSDISTDTLTSGDRGIRAPFGAGASPVPYPNAGGQAFPGGGVGSWQPTNQRDQLANIMSGSQGNEGAQNIGRGFATAGGGTPQAPAGTGGFTPPPVSGFGAMPGGNMMGRAMQMPSAMGGASPRGPSLGGGWGQSSVPQTGPAGTSALGSSFGQRSPQSYINSNFGSFDPGTPSAGNITMGDRLRGQGPPALSPFMGPNAFQPRR